MITGQVCVLYEAQRIGLGQFGGGMDKSRREYFILNN